mgnify:CR=1 FL=1
MATEYPRWSVRRITNHTLRKFTPFKWSLDHLTPGALIATPDCVFVTRTEANAEAERRNELAAQGIEVRTIVHCGVLGVETIDALGKVTWVTTTEWYRQVDA